MGHAAPPTASPADPSARFLAELDPAIFVLDCLANMANVPVVERTQAVVKLLREHHGDTPILILEEREWADAALVPTRRQSHVDRCRELNLRLTDSEESTKIDFMVFLTVQTMNYLHSGRHRVAL